MSVSELYASVHARRRPEDVAEVCLHLLEGELTTAQQSLLKKAARGSLKNAWGYTSMSQEFRRPVGAAGMLPTAARLFPNVPVISKDAAGSPELLEKYLVLLNEQIGKAPGFNDFKQHRLSHSQRKEIGLDLSRRQYNKLFRYVAHLEAKLAVLRREWRKYEFTLISKSKLATRIPESDFSSDVGTACFIAYYVARCNLRSEFTNTGQVQAFDEISEMLLNRCRRSSTANWWAIAHVFPESDVLAYLKPEQKGALLAEFYSVLAEIAAFLGEIAEGTDINRATMIVKRGNDSTTWNQTAGAWNKARDSWFALLHALNMDEVLDAVCPGKVPRLMAADVAYWHRISGGGLHPDTAIWAELPSPWKVLRGEAVCTRKDVETVCEKHGLNPEKTGWTAPRPAKKAAKFTPTPELVHGVTVVNPVFAKVLRDAGVFSGKSVQPSAAVKKAQLN